MEVTCGDEHRLDTGEYTLQALQPWNAHHFLHRPLHWAEAGET
jgi:hypothetical protein